MKWPSRSQQKISISESLIRHARDIRDLPGLRGSASLNTLAMQFIASLRREDYYANIQQKTIDPTRADPHNAKFDAERAVAYHLQNDDIEEATWLVFLMTHFARPADTGWLRLKDVYGKLGQGLWSWRVVIEDPTAFSEWVYTNSAVIRGKFGNHRKYESLQRGAKREFSIVLRSYINLIGGNHSTFFARLIRDAGNDPTIIFDHLYRSMSVVHSFGRLAKFDYLMLVGRYGIAPISPGSAYLGGATGPANGARLLFLGDPSATISTAQVQDWLNELDRSLGVGMAVMEDALCNWQKSPERFVHFKG